jgi:hypothetical protein
MIVARSTKTTEGNDMATIAYRQGKLGTKIVSTMTHRQAEMWMNAHTADLVLVSIK